MQLAVSILRSTITTSALTHSPRVHGTVSVLPDRPSLCLLVSGLHALLKSVRGPRATDFEFLGDCADVAPGQALDKVTWHLKLNRRL